MVSRRAGLQAFGQLDFTENYRYENNTIAHKLLSSKHYDTQIARELLIAKVQ